MKKKSKKKSLTGLKKKLWKQFSLYVRERDHWTCITCGVVAYGKYMHAGHFLPKKCYGLVLYFHEDNVHAQCSSCNFRYQGHQYLHGAAMGRSRVNKIFKLVDNWDEWSREDYQKKIKYYQKKYEQILSERTGR